VSIHTMIVYPAQKQSSAKLHVSLTNALLATCVLKNQMLTDLTSQTKLTLAPLAITALKVLNHLSSALLALSPIQLPPSRLVSAQCANPESTATTTAGFPRDVLKVPTAQWLVSCLHTALRELSSQLPTRAVSMTADHASVVTTVIR